MDTDQIAPNFGILGATDQASSEGMYEVILEVMRRADTGINVGYAIIYEVSRQLPAFIPIIRF